MFEILAALLLAATFSPGAAQRLEQASSAKNDYNLSYDAREESLVFARSEAEFRNAKIFVSAKRKGRWAAPHPISFSDPRYSDSDPWLTPDGKTLYFVSNRPTAARGSRKDLDIWMSRRLRSGWSAPEHLGDKVNTPGEELGPELHDNVLYFSSTRAGGRGGLDIYSATGKGSRFSNPLPLGEPFNSERSESDFTISPDGKQAAFWRLVEGRGVIHIARKEGGTWSDPVPLPKEVNLGDFNFTPSFSSDMKRFRFASNVVREGQEAGASDIFELPLR
jgi:hypothetical protein